ncbi:unnamed protein product [Oncorhynchus mykiss]|uniref:A-type potassium channel modulatory protein DPP6 n=1 Tax=Oncorhynchus mykiss TaxID=8022 RepID=A0A060W484_ONCMY|nr:unnamed protein product [Oncorhynchus mykiss]
MLWFEEPLSKMETWNLNPPEVRNAQLQYAGWGPTGQQLIFIFENNIYYRSTVESRSIRLVSTGKEGVIFNGLSDWLYEEEIFQTHIAHWWSPDGARLAYATINDTMVPKMEIPMFTGTTYPTGREYHYPKAGEENPVISLYVVNLNGPLHTMEMRRPEDQRMGEYYVTMVKWATTTKLAVNWLNRAQNISMLTLCQATTGVCTKKHEDESESWLHRQNEEPLFSKDGLKLFFTRAIPQGGRGKFFHISMSITQPNTSTDTLQSITSGDWDVTQVLAYNEDSQLIYFLSTEDDPKRRHLYSADTVGPFNRRCLSCDFYESCGYVKGSFSHNMSLFLLSCKGPDVPFVAVYSTQDRQKVFDLETNENLRIRLDSMQMPHVEYKEITMEDYTLTMQILKPASFVDSSHYPLLLLVDSTPGGQMVSELFQMDWATVLVSSFGAMVLRFDGRGSGFQGTNLLHRVQRKLGVFEERDQLEALSIISKEPYVDKTRIGAFGKVYGGYVTSLLLSAEDSPVKCGVALSPITDFDLYASAFSERYLGMPKPDPRAYAMANLAHRASQFLDKKFLIVHPTADEKVHFQHTAKFISQLINEKANYTLQIYPDEGHFIHSEATQQHLSQSLVNFFEECFRLPEKVFEERQEEEIEEEDKTNPPKQSSSLRLSTIPAPILGFTIHIICNLLLVSTLFSSFFFQFSPSVFPLLFHMINPETAALQINPETAALQINPETAALQINPETAALQINQSPHPQFFSSSPSPFDSARLHKRLSAAIFLTSTQLIHYDEGPLADVISGACGCARNRHSLVILCLKGQAPWIPNNWWEGRNIKIHTQALPVSEEGRLYSTNFTSQ